MVHSIKVCPFFRERRLCGAHMCTCGRVDVQYGTFLLLLVFECSYAITRISGHEKLLEEVFGGLKPCGKLVHKRISSDISRRQMDRILRVDAGRRIRVFYGKLCTEVIIWDNYGSTLYDSACVV